MQNQPNAKVRCSNEALPRLLLILSALLVFVSIWLPYWKAHITAPQYPKGLNVIVYVTGARGDVREVDGLNHYIGMRPLEEAAPFERKISVPGLSAVALALLVLAFVRRPAWLQYLLALPVAAVPIVFAADLYYWLRLFGLNLDPNAPLNKMVKPFVPPLLGTGKLAQFGVTSTFQIGYFLVVIAALLTLYAVYCRRQAEIGKAPAVSPTQKPVKAKALIPLLLLIWLVPQAYSKEWVVEPNGTLSLQQALEQAQSGDTIRVRGGIHKGNFKVDKTITLIGENSPVLDGEGKGSVLHLGAPRCVVRGFHIRNSGIILNAQDSGIRVSKPECLVESNRLEAVLFGVHLEHAPYTIVRNNQIRSHDLPVARRGDQIRVWYSHHSVIEGNQVEGGRDLVYWYSENITIRNNTVRNSRYGVHFMYCDQSLVEGNHLEGNSVAIYIMYSKRVRLQVNRLLHSRGVSGMGLGIKDSYQLQVERNLIANNRIGIFIDGGEGTYRENWIVRNDVGFHLVQAVEPNYFEKNQIIENTEQVRSERPDSVRGVRWTGNYWSDYIGYDLDGDGVGDVPYRLVRVFDQVASQNSALRLFEYSPSAQALDFSARLFPLFVPQPRAEDPQPLMHWMAYPALSASTHSSLHWLFASLGLLMVGTLGLGAVSLRRRKQETRSSERTFSSMANVGPMVVAVEGLTRRFGSLVAVDHLSLKVRMGETIALWGANGAGKTTVLRCLLGLLRFEGSAYVLGYSVKSESLFVRQQVGYVPQLIHLHPDMTVEETVAFYARLRGVSESEGAILLEQWGLQEHRAKPVSALSGGLKQKLALVIALLGDPPLLLLDEPTAHLDTSARAEWLELLRQLKEAGKTLIFCTHQFSEVRALADRVIVLERGRKVADLGGAQFVSLWQSRGMLKLIVPSDQLSQAEQLLRSAGYAVELEDGLVTVHQLESTRIEPLRVLWEAGIEVIDYEWQAPIDPPEWTQLTPHSEPATESDPPLALFPNPRASFSFLRVVRTLVNKELRDARRNQWFLLLTAIFTGLSILLTLFGLSGLGQTIGVMGYGRTFASLLNLSLLIVPLMGLLLGAIAIASERDQQTLHTLLAQPLTASSLLIGKFLGAMLTLSSAILIGFGSSGLLIYALGGDVPLTRFLAQVGLTLGLGWSCLALGLVLSVIAKRASTAVGIALLLWFVLVFVSDLGIIGTAVVLRLKASTLLWLAMLNPLQVFKMGVLLLMEGNLEVLGSAGMVAREVLGDALLPTLMAILSAWLLIPFTTALGWFTRKGAIG